MKQEFVVNLVLQGQVAGCPMVVGKDRKRRKSKIGPLYQKASFIDNHTV